MLVKQVFGCKAIIRTLTNLFLDLGTYRYHNPSTCLVPAALPDSFGTYPRGYVSALRGVRPWRGVKTCSLGTRLVSSTFCVGVFSNESSSREVFYEEAEDKSATRRSKEGRRRALRRISRRVQALQKGCAFLRNADHKRQGRH